MIIIRIPDSSLDLSVDFYRLLSFLMPYINIKPKSFEVPWDLVA